MTAVRIFRSQSRRELENGGRAYNVPDLGGPHNQNPVVKKATVVAGLD